MDSRLSRKTMLELFKDLSFCLEVGLRSGTGIYRFFKGCGRYFNVLLYTTHWVFIVFNHLGDAIIIVRIIGIVVDTPEEISDFCLNGSVIFTSLHF